MFGIKPVSWSVYIIEMRPLETTNAIVSLCEEHIFFINNVIIEPAITKIAVL